MPKAELHGSVTYKKERKNKMKDLKENWENEEILFNETEEEYDDDDADCFCD